MLTVSDMIAKRKRIWEERGDLDYDRDLVRAAAVKILSTPSLITEIRERPYLLIEISFYIVDKKKKTVPFFLNEVQTDFIQKFEAYGTKKPYYVLKGRQQGFTSLITAMQLSFAIVRPNFSGMTLADRSDNTKAIFNDKGRMVYERLPDELKPTERFNSVNELFFDKLNSSWRIATATNKVGRSRTLNFVHFSEVAFYECSLADLQKGIGEAMTEDCFRIYETTANGFNEAKDLWDSGSCVNLFYEWWRTNEYRSTDYQYLQTDDAWLLERIELLRQKGLDREQITWYCKKYASYLDKNTIKQEYPCTPEEAFISSGNCVFDKEKLANQIVRVAKLQPLRCGYFTYHKRAVVIKDGKGEPIDTEWEIEDIEFVEARDGYIWIHEEPRVKKAKDGVITARAPYVIGGDTAEAGEDYYAAKVVCNLDARTVATLHRKHIDEDLYAEQLYCLGRYYHNAVIGIETNYSRYPTRLLAHKFSYPNLYMRERFDKTHDEVEQVFVFLTTKATKKMIIEDLVRRFREEPEIEPHLATLKEMTTFVKKENGAQEAMDGYHDDLVMSLAIAHQVSGQQSFGWLAVEQEPDRFFQENFHHDVSFSSGDSYMDWEDY